MSTQSADAKGTPPTRRWRFRFGLKTLLAFTTVCALVTWYLSGYMPGTFYFDELGFPHGTGTARYYYESGGLKLEETYLAGNPKTSRWYRPDGSLVAETRWKAGSGTGIYLREDGTIRAQYAYVNQLANGQATYYAKDGSVERVATFRDGVEVNP